MNQFKFSSHPELTELKWNYVSYPGLM
uniref:Uncharacterized protein n=1 Tax=Anguilla anguilla TaxID=7936 RepID=A0A0E9TF14_ANGAN